MNGFCQVEDTCRKPVTRKESDIWLVGQLSSTLSTTKLSSKQVLALFFYYKEVEGKTVRDASHCTTEDIMKVWNKANIPTRLKKHVVKKVEEMFKEWAKLKKNKAKRSEGLQLKETKWRELLKGRFDIAHAEAMNLITIEEDRKFLVAKRETGRSGLIGTVDKALHTQQARSQKKQKSFERRKAQAEEEKICREQEIYLESSSEEDAPVLAIVDGEVPVLENVCASNSSNNITATSINIRHFLQYQSH